MKTKITCIKTRLENPLTGDWGLIKEYYFDDGINMYGRLTLCDKIKGRKDKYTYYSSLPFSYTSRDLRLIADKLDKLNGQNK